MSEPDIPAGPARRWKSPLSRQRFVELLVVIFGVLIALGLDNLIQEIRFRADARELEQAFIVDLQEATFQSLERQVVTPCLVQRLRLLWERLETENSEWTPPLAALPDNLEFATAQIYRTPTRIWVTSSFDRAQGSEAFKRIPADRAAEYAVTFALISSLGKLNDAELIATAGLAPLAYRHTILDAEVRADALQQVALLDRYQALLGIGSEQLVRSAFSLPEVGDDVHIIFERDTDLVRARFVSTKKTYGRCADLTVLDRLPLPQQPPSKR